MAKTLKRPRTPKPNLTARAAERQGSERVVEIMEALKGSLARNGGVEQVIRVATEVLGDRDEALRWMGMPVAALNFATPISVLGTAKGAARVAEVLTQMEHGVW